VGHPVLTQQQFSYFNGLFLSINVLSLFPRQHYFFFKHSLGFAGDVRMSSIV
jgi:hypothetical protein